MALVATPKGGGNFPIPDPDWYPARCFACIDLGTQAGSYQGKPNMKHKIILGFELVGTHKSPEDPGPFAIWKRFTLSFVDNAALRKFLGSWRGKAFTPEEAEAGYDVAQLAKRGTPVYLNIVHEQARDNSGKVYAQIDSCGPVPKALGAVPAATIPTVVFDIDEFDQAVFDAFSDNLKETIKKSPEYAAAMARRHAPMQDSVRQPGDDDAFGMAHEEEGGFDPNEDVPF